MLVPERSRSEGTLTVCVCGCFLLIYSGHQVRWTYQPARGHTGGRSHRISDPPFFCDACLNFCRVFLSLFFSELSDNYEVSSLYCSYNNVRTGYSEYAGGISIFPAKLITSKIGNLTRSIHTLL